MNVLAILCNCLHLDQESLELTEGTIVMLGSNSCSGHDCCNIGEDIPHGSVEHETVDWLVEGLGTKEGDSNESAPCQRQD